MNKLTLSRKPEVSKKMRYNKVFCSRQYPFRGIARILIEAYIATSFVDIAAI